MGNQLCCISHDNQFNNSIISKNSYKSTKNTSFSIMNASMKSCSEQQAYLEQASQLFLKQKIDINIDINSESDEEFEEESLQTSLSNDDDFENLF